LNVGSEVWSIDPATLQKVRGRVVRHHSSWGLCRRLHWPGGALRATGEHPLYDPEIGDYREAREWQAGDRHALLAADGHVLTVTSDDWLGTPCAVYDLTIDSPHHNFVAGGVVVHNKQPDPECGVYGLSCPPGEFCDVLSCYSCDLNSCSRPECGGGCTIGDSCTIGRICVVHVATECGTCRIPLSSCTDQCQTDNDCLATEVCVNEWDGCFRCAPIRSDCATVCPDGTACAEASSGALAACFRLAATAYCYDTLCEPGGTCETSGGVCVIEGWCRFCDLPSGQFP